jgi:5,10-methylenetetrahydromethanopterin reductase
MRIGPFIGTMGAADTLQGQVQQVADAESDGFDSFWTAQVFGVDALTMLALSGEKTRTIEVGTAVVPTYPRHPTALAQQALTTQAAMGGRLLLGIGLSHKPIVEGRWGMSFRSPARHMEEYLTILQSLMDTGSVDFRGDHFTVSGDINRLTDSPPTVCIAALGRRMLHLAGSRAGGTITWMVGPRTLDSHIVPRITAAADEAGRPPPRVCVGLPVCVSDDRHAAFEAASDYFHGYGNLPSYRRMLDIEGVESPAEVAIIGNEAEVESQLRDLSSAGATDLLASVFPAGEDADASTVRTFDLLKSLVGRV